MTLLFILATPPVTSGSRTTARVDMASDIIGFSRPRVVNLFPIVTRSVTDISALGIEQDPWVVNRGALLDALGEANEVFLAYGVAEPSGPARVHHRSQVQWLHEQISQLELKTWTVGGRTRHPSRWQRYTSKIYPTLTFRDALKLSLQTEADNLGLVN